MRIGILSRSQNLYSTGRLVDAALARDHEVSVIDTLKIPVKVGSKERNGRPLARLPQVEAIIPRIGTSITFYGLAVVRQFEARGVLTTATSRAIAQSRDKLHSLQIMSESGLPIPSTTVIAHAGDIWPAIEIAGGLPVIIKLIRGTQGRGVFLVSELHTVESIWNTLNRLREQMLVQEYIREAQGQDTRIIVVGNRCIAAMRRTAAKGEFRSNLHRGGTAESVSLDAHSRRLAVQAAQAHGLAVAGVDILQSNRGPLLLEVNSSPGLQGIETATQVDIADAIIHYLEDEQRKRQRQQRQKRKSR
jgi:ribosomal protein S6--L-glutamate ligase